MCGQSQPLASQLRRREIGRIERDLTKLLVLPLHAPQPPIMIPGPPLHVRDNVLVGRDKEHALPHGSDHLLRHIVRPQYAVIARHSTCAIRQHARCHGLWAEAGHLDA